MAKAQTTSYVLVGGGSPADWPSAILEETNSRFVGIDNGSFHLLERNQPIWFAIGDFDSVQPDELVSLRSRVDRMYTSHPEKDDTDTQLALAKVFEECPAAEVRIIGGTGGRLDHFLANFWLPLEPRFQPYTRQITLLDRLNTITYYLPGEYTIQKEADKKYLAYVCLSPVEDLSLYGSKYTLKNQQVLVPTSYASNEFITSEASFSFRTGTMAVIQSADGSKLLS